MNPEQYANPSPVLFIVQEITHDNITSNDEKKDLKRQSMVAHPEPAVVSPPPPYNGAV